MALPIHAKKIIFVVDDDPAHVRVCERILRRAGYGVVTASDGDKALRILAQTSVDVILLDIVMPQRDGFETLMALRSMHSTAPIIAMSGSGEPEINNNMLVQCRLLGATDGLSKPFSESELLRAVENAMLRPTFQSTRNQLTHAHER